MNPKKLDTITSWPTPANVKNIQQFLGFTNFYRRFIDDYSKITLPLTALTRKDTPFDWSSSAQLAFDTLKQKFSSSPVLHYFDPSLPCTLATDGSDFAISGILQQPDANGDLHPVAFYSRKLSPAEINYEVHDKELLAVVESFRDMRAWLLGSPFPIAVITDHKNLQYFMSAQILNRRQARWAMFLSDFDFRLDWAPGESNVADAPSRRPDFVPKKGDSTFENQSRVILTPKHTERIFPSSRKDIPFKPSISALTTLQIDNSQILDRFKTAYQEDTEWREALVRGNSEFAAESGLVFHKGKLFVPASLRQDVLHSRHDVVTSGHPGRTRTFNSVSKDYSWPGMYTYVRRYVDACDICPRTKNPRHKPYGLLKPLDIPERPWKAITMDFIVKLPISHNFDSIWVVCDRLTRAAHFISCRESMSAPELAWLFLDRIFRYHGIPESIVSDRGSTFVSKFWKELMNLLKTEIKTSTAYHPQTNGLTERTNQTLETYLRAYCSYQQDDWVDYLPLAEFAFNNSENSSTKQTPFYANYAFHPTFEPQITERSTVPAAADLAQRLEVIHAELRAELEFAQQVQSKNYNTTHKPDPDFQPNQLVWLLRRNIKTNRPSDKLDHRRLGPYKIIRKVHSPSSNAYLLDLPSYLSRLHPVFNASLLESYSDPSQFHPHASPQPFQLDSDSDPILDIQSLRDCRKIGHRYEYLVHWKSLSSDEDSWVPLSDIPTSCNEMIERFHRRHTKAPRPHLIAINKSFSIPSDLDLVEPSTPSSSDPAPSEPVLAMPSVPSAPAVPVAFVRPATPPAPRMNLREVYVPPSRTTTRTGRVSRPAAHLDTRSS